MEILKPALEEARRGGYRKLQATMLSQLARIAMWQMDADTAGKYIGEALEIARAEGDNAALVFSLRQMGNIVSRTDPASAKTYHEESVKLARQIGDSRSEANGLNSLGIALNFIGETEAAKAAFGRALEIFRRLGERAQESMVLGNLASLMSFTGELGPAERYAKEAVAIGHDVGAPGLVTSAKVALADICLRTGRDAEALACTRDACALMRTIGIPPFPAVFLYGLLRLRAGDRPKGLAWIGFARAHDPSEVEAGMAFRSYWDEIRGGEPEEAVEAALRAGESLKLEDILAETELP